MPDPAPSPTPTLSVIVVSYNTRDMTLDCLASLRDETVAAFETIVAKIVKAVVHRVLLEPLARFFDGIAILNAVKCDHSAGCLILKAAKDSKYPAGDIVGRGRQLFCGVRPCAFVLDVCGQDSRCGKFRRRGRHTRARYSTRDRRK